MVTSVIFVASCQKPLTLEDSSDDGCPWRTPVALETADVGSPQGRREPLEPSNVAGPKQKLCRCMSYFTRTRRVVALGKRTRGAYQIYTHRGEIPPAPSYSPDCPWRTPVTLAGPEPLEACKGYDQGECPWKTARATAAHCPWKTLVTPAALRLLVDCSKNCPAAS